jgi:NADP-reducing hydrogenase subunit HndB
MAKITVDDLKRIKKDYEQTFTVREGGQRAKVTVHMGTCGIAAGAREVMNALMEAMGESGVVDVIVSNSGCAGLCSKEPMATVELRGEPPVRYVMLTPEKMKRIFAEHIVGGKAVEEFAFATGCETSY